MTHASVSRASIDDDCATGGGLVESRSKPWWQDDPELEAIRRRTREEILGDPRDPVECDRPDPVVAEMYSGASWRELAEARDDLARSRARYETAVQTARAAGLSWAEIGRVLRVPKQLLHCRFRSAMTPPAL
jgi:DNA-directed RNA polymerase specialized sigma24 family protein